MGSAGSAKVGDEITVCGVDGQIVGTAKYAAPGLNWAVWEVEANGETQWLTRLEGELYETETAAGDENGPQAEGFRLIREGEAQCELEGRTGREFNRRPYKYWRRDDGGIAVATQSREGWEIVIGRPLDSALVEVFPA